MEDIRFNKSRDIQIPSHPIWGMQYAGSVATMDQGGPYETHRHVLHRLSGRGTHIFEYPTRTLKRLLQYARGNTEFGDEGQIIQTQIPPKRYRIPRIYHWTRRGQDRPSQDTSHMRLDNTQENQRNPILPRVVQLLLTIYRKLQLNGQTAIGENNKGIHLQLGMGRQITTSMRRIKNIIQHNTGSGLLRPPRTYQDCNRYLKICLLQYTIIVMQGGKMEASGIPI